MCQSWPISSFAATHIVCISKSTCASPKAAQHALAKIAQNWHHRATQVFKLFWLRQNKHTQCNSVSERRKYRQNWVQEQTSLPWVDAIQHRWRRLQPRPLMCHSPHPPCANHLTPPGHTQHSGVPLAILCCSTAHCCSCAALPHLQTPGNHPVCSWHCHVISTRLMS